VGRDDRIDVLEEFRQSTDVISVVVGEDDEPNVREFVVQRSQVGPETADGTVGTDIAQHESAFGLDDRRSHRNLCLRTRPRSGARERQRPPAYEGHCSATTIGVGGSVAVDDAEREEIVARHRGVVFSRHHRPL